MRNRPVDEIRDGAIYASIWQNHGDNGPFYSVTFGRTYTDENDKPQTSDSFSAGQVLKLSVLAVQVYHRVRELQIRDKKAA